MNKKNDTPDEKDVFAEKAKEYLDKSSKEMEEQIIDNIWGF
ncbi:hypothetical protein [Candidatus Uabimicrobium amorphum]|uniref:Uncharacterized protein n=1 Tax=Uabimicrobium amorphum TaxID=2596890 RepID=A0A5S9F3K0_UABAM|nr:hypothetical protein [Candidatus Uabimicrobium amorphum]BBM84578.1 hypothetical protein UABAM_02939 [Candidatus Uabimicrobium amorphum]